jgi:outer membrane protein assembly factor BamE (lipoprotein component of BamABCDE complex)
MNRISRSIVMLVMACLASCAASTDPAAFGQKAQTEVRKGMTKSQVRSILGAPIVATTLNGADTWHYQKNNILKAMIPLRLGGAESNNVAIMFSPQGTVTNITNVGVGYTPGLFAR